RPADPVKVFRDARAARAAATQVGRMKFPIDECLSPALTTPRPRAGRSRRRERAGRHAHVRPAGGAPVAAVTSPSVLRCFDGGASDDNPVARAPRRRRLTMTTDYIGVRQVPVSVSPKTPAARKKVLARLAVMQREM